QHRFGAGGQPAKLRNILIIVQESLGARFIGALGGLPLSPYLDTMADQGIWFERLYATGIRSARGLEAIVVGFPPSPARSVLKLSGSQTGFYTMAETLRPLGYRNYFIYGGEAHFDNMQGFFLNNGFDEAIDINDYDEWIFKGTWGVSDEDLLEKTHQVLKNSEQPVFAVAFTSSFHSPFEFPDGRIELYEEPKQSKHNAVKYADYAVGQFIEKARQSDYWQDTLVLIVADHDERPRGYDLVPVSSYHIPGVILGADVTPRKVSRITSQIDLIPTLLGLAGISGIAPFPGENVLAAPADSQGRAVMQYGDNHAYMRGDQVVIHRPDLPAAQFGYDRQSDLLEPVLLSPEMADRALAWALLPGLLYREKLYGVYRQESLPVAEK
ncbi:MAG: LTA synthase family protein, partial [Proteobacteria bacterium]|nr:LTA synthase family protein [Pseudomonadota bacterium]